MYSEDVQLFSVLSNRRRFIEIENDFPFCVSLFSKTILNFYYIQLTRWLISVKVWTIFIFMGKKKDFPEDT